MQTLHEQEPPAPNLLPVHHATQEEQIPVTVPLVLSTPPRKRLVSKSRYALSVGIKTVFASASAALLMIGLMSLVVACITILALCQSQPPSLVPYLWMVLLITGGSGGYCVYIGRRMLKEIKSIKTGVPLTRANTADLPAPDSLVRASQEPTQAQEGVLLRAASGEAQAGQEGQLLRASAGE